MAEEGKIRYHLGAVFVVGVWGTTFIATKVLLEDFRPLEIMFVRFAVGYLTLCLLAPHPLRNGNKLLDVYYALSGFLGLTLYYVLENTALTYTYAANVGIIIASVPFFTGLLALLIYRDRSCLNPFFFLGFVMAMAGIVLISLNGAKLELNPLGDILTVLAALSWAGYSMVLKKIQSYGPVSLAGNRRIFFWGSVFTFPVWLLEGRREGFSHAVTLRNVLLFLFLGVLACAICYVLWNRAVENLGPVETNLYIYLNPVTTLVAAVLILHERLTAQCMVGTVLILAGLILSEAKLGKGGSRGSEEK